MERVEEIEGKKGTTTNVRIEKKKVRVTVRAENKGEHS